ncbi:hypothetical protein [Methylobacterium haplocladii]|uniref:Uncharacterized protein n=1 Tax=Methylobacterium haplocladii TaxID=1176176 RepID=A0A512IR49_9HYPH|nr:hypothetical protein [Methylobacterium haplocladii]GEP00180.1 hypothetical protein MHA02_25670 [Methylobacterium haplocladii]GJD83765.1 hypothetical protein HPGCJGGD_1636 [Methylobacterium haplocladii]GLS57974.1 hypothetical protein GCM10007887_06300 [Methylobacterium haplocladii]
MIDHTAKGALLCRAIRVLADFDVSLVITSTAGQAYHFEMDGEPAQEGDLITRAAMLDATFFNVRQDNRSDERRQRA